jgi:choline dehydrogenase-like flavoprotein
VHVDARTLEHGTLIEGDLCIVGAGAAGISLALEWRGAGHRVILLEGGGFELESEVQDLYRGEIAGRRYYPLQSARLHFFGGTTGHWGGHCAPYDAQDFEAREWVPGSGWPIGRADLDPYYARVHPLVEVPGPFEYDAGYWEREDPDLRRLPFDARRVWTKIWQFSPPTRFGTRYRDALLRAPDVHLYTHANVCNIEADASVTRIDGLEVRGFDGRRQQVRARAYVLACCAIQNARLLLASNGRASAGLGNDRDQVGRYFMDHLEVATARLVLPAPGPLKLYLYDTFQTRIHGQLALTAEAQREQRILNGTVALIPAPLADPSAAIDWFPADAGEVLKIWDEMERAYRAGERPRADPSKYREFVLFARQEQAPNPASRITLSGEKDALGVPRARLDWRLSDLDARSMRAMHRVLGREVGRSGIGRLRLDEWLTRDAPAWPDTLGGGWHHMGTTRMHADPKHGVVDANCKVHGIANLYVASSGVHPTSGAANPTLTLLALTLRLSDHLKAAFAARRI